MILKFCLVFYGIDALKKENHISNREFETFLDRRNRSLAGPKFNENCDENSLEAARECEA